MAKDSKGSEPKSTEVVISINKEEKAGKISDKTHGIMISMRIPFEVAT